MKLKPNPSCDDTHCRARQAEQPIQLPSISSTIPSSETENPVFHEDNEWGETKLAQRLHFDW